MGQSPELVPRTEHPPRWALGLLALLLIALGALSFLGLQSLDPEGSVAGNPANFSRPSSAPARAPGQVLPAGEQAPPAGEQAEALAPGRVTELEVLLKVPADRALVGRQVTLEDVPVQSVVGDHTFWIGPDRESRVPVVLRGELMARQPEERVEVREGMRLRVFGVVRELREVEVLEEARFLSAGEREALEQAELFISAVRVVPLGP